jgi:hypothetical protein
MACTGAVVANVMTDPQYTPPGTTQLQQLQALDDSTFSVITMSMGGNDVGFAKIAEYCLLFPVKTRLDDATTAGGTCGELINEVQQQLQTGAYVGVPSATHNKLLADLRNMYRAVLAAAEDDGATLIVNGYVRFFNQEDQEGTPDQDCATKTLEVTSSAFDHIVPGYFSPRLTVSLRQTINEAVLAMNNLIEGAIGDINAEYQAKQSSRRARYVDIDQFAEGHRFCDKGADGKLFAFKSENILIHLTNTNDMTTDPSQGIPIVGPRDPTASLGPPLLSRDYQDGDCDVLSDTEALWRCWLNQMTGPDDINQDLYPELGSSFEKRKIWKAYDMKRAFHPKSWIYTRAAQETLNSWTTWQKDRPCGCDVV